MLGKIFIDYLKKLYIMDPMGRVPTSGAWRNAASSLSTAMYSPCESLRGPTEGTMQLPCKNPFCVRTGKRWGGWLGMAEWDRLEEGGCLPFSSGQVFFFSSLCARQELGCRLERGELQQRTSSTFIAGIVKC